MDPIKFIEGVLDTARDAAQHHPNLDPYGKESLHYSASERESHEVMQALLAMPTPELERLFVALAGSFLRIGHEWQPFAPLDPAMVALTQWVGALLPAYRDLGQEYLLMYSKAKLEAVAEELCGPAARAWAGLTRKVIAEHVVAHAGARLDEVPSEMLMPAADAAQGAG